MFGTEPDPKAIFCEALEKPNASERAAYLDQVCGGDAPLRNRIETLLKAHGEAGSFIERHAEIPTIADALSEREGVGEVIGPYRLMEQIGEGGMGVVYVAEQAHPVRRRVALKVIKPGMDSRQVIARFEAERQALALMDHPNIARVHDAGATEQGRPYFVMELVRGIPITEYCDREQLSIRERLDLFVLVCRAVQHAHQKGIIHRDLKPSNVLVTVIDGAAVPKVIDFGVAKATGASLTEKTIYTAFHQMVGTPLYMSPEQADLAGTDVDTRSDLYSLGVLLYELLTGTTPFDPETLKKAAFDEIRRIIREEEPAKPSTRLSTPGEVLSAVSARRKADPRSLGRSMRGELDWVVMKALEKDRRRRYETANDFAADVLNFLADRPVEACPPSARYRFSKYARRNRAALTTGVLVGLALIAGTAVSTWQAVRATAAERAAEDQKARAEERSRQARRAVDEMYTQVAEKWLSQQPNLTRVQAEFLEKALGFYEAFAKDQSNDPSAQFESARARRRVGAIRRGLGEFDLAAAAFRQSIAQLEALGDRFPTHPEYPSELSTTRIDLAELENELGRPEAAGPLLERAVETMEALVVRDPKGRDSRGRLATSLGALGMLRHEQRRDIEAESLLLRGLGLFDRLQAEGPLEPEFLGPHASCMNGLGRVYNEMKRPRDAEAYYESGVKRLDSWLVAEPTNPRARRSLAATLSNLASIRYAAGRRDEARESEARCIALLETLAAEFPQLHELRGLLLKCRMNRFLRLAEDARAAEAEPEFRRALDQGESLVRDHPEIPDYRRCLAIVLCLAADLHSAAPAEAFHDPGRARDLARHAIDVNPQGELARQSLGWALYRTGDWKGCLDAFESDPGFARSGDFLAAMASWRLGDRAKAEATFLLSDLHLTRYEKRWNASVYPNPSMLRRFRAEATALLGISDEPGDDPSERALRRVDAELDRLAAGLTDRPDLRDVVARLCFQVAHWYRDANRHRDSVRYFERALELVRPLASSQPARAEHQQLLFDCLNRLSTEYSTYVDPEDRNLSRAVELAREAVGLKAEDANTWENLGWALYRNGDWKDCIAALERSMELANQGTGWDWFFLAMAHHQLGDRTRAKAEYDRAVAWLVALPTDAAYRPRAEKIRDEAAALLGLKLAAAGVTAKSGAGPEVPPR